MGLKVFQIVLYNPTETYYPGETVAGHVLLSLSSSKTMSGGQNELFIGNTNDSGV
jgi:hypothetical protein